MDTLEAAQRWATTWEQAWPLRDVEAIVQLQADDGDHWASMFRRIHGHDALRDYLRECFEEETAPAETMFGEPAVDGRHACVEYYVVIHLADGPTTISGCTVLHFDGFGLVKQARDYSHAKKGRHEPPVVEFTECGGQWPEQPVELHDSISFNGDSSERCQLAGHEDLSPAVVDRLARDADPEVRVNLAMNEAVPGEILLGMMRRHPELTSFVTMNANAPAFLKESVPVMELSNVSLEQYLKDMNATPEETTAFMVAYNRLLDKWSRKARKAGDDTIDGTRLGELWRTIRPHE
ncbi:MAG: nuclear transport factor 2 family protein [Specibacter sp.]